MRVYIYICTSADFFAPVCYVYISGAPLVTLFSKKKNLKGFGKFVSTRGYEIFDLYGELLLDNL